MNENLYAENILEHYRHPCAKGELKDPTITHKEVNASCGDIIILHLKITDEKIDEAQWEGEGCAISQAGMSMLAEKLKGLSLAEANNLVAKDMHELLGVSIGIRRMKCALLGLHALKNTLHTYRKESLQSWNETMED